MKDRLESSTLTQRFDSLEQEAFLNLWRTYDRLKVLEEDLFSQFEISPQQYNILRLLRAVHPRLVPTLTIAERLISRAPDITRMLDKLEQRGLVYRERPGYDRRTVLIGITPDGLALLTAMAQPLRHCHFRQLGHLSSQELNQLIALLRRARLPHEPEGSQWKED